MKIKFYDNHYIKGVSGADVEPFTIDDSWGEEPNLLLWCSNEDVKNQLVSNISERYSNRRSFTALQMNAVLDDSLTVNGKRVKECSIALLLFHRGGAVSLQTGEGRVLQVRPHEKAAVYDSRDQVLDIYSSKAKVMELSDLNAGDYFLVTTAGKFAVDKVIGALSNATQGDEAKVRTLTELMGAADSALWLSHVDNVEGAAGFNLPDISRRSMTIIGLLALAVIALGALSFLPKCSFEWPKADVEEAETVSGEASEATSTPSDGSEVERPGDAVDVNQDPVRDEPKKEAEKKEEKKAEKKADEPKKAEKPVETDKPSTTPEQTTPAKPVEPIKPVTTQPTVTPPTVTPPSTTPPPAE